VLVTSLKDEVRTIAQHYRDRGDSENNFDELKNQWAWAGFTTHDRKRCQVMARVTALIYNWWTIYMRLGIPDKHAEAITSRPLALHGIARRIRHSNQTTVEVTSTHSKALVIAVADQGERVPQANQGDCGAVNSSRTLAADSQRRLSVFSPWEGARKRWPSGRSYRLTAVFRLIYALHALGTHPVPTSLTALVPEGR
jgi:hypothetical protein